MGAGYGGTGESLNYQESADFKLGGHGTVLLGFVSTISIGNGFDSSTFQIFINGALFLSQSFNDLASANSFFTNHILDLGQFSGGVTDVDLLYSETMSTTQGFGFTYAFAASGFNAVPSRHLGDDAARHLLRSALWPIAGRRRARRCSQSRRARPASSAKKEAPSDNA